MFDTMTITKAGGALCGAFLIFLLGKWAAESLYHTGPVAHGGEEVAQAYTIDTGAGGEAAPAAEAGPDFATLLASADAGAGEKVFGKVQGLPQDRRHQLHRSASRRCGRPRGRVDRGLQLFRRHEGAWRRLDAGDALNAFLENPKGVVAGTKMSFAGLKKPEDRANLIAYLQTLGG